MSVQYVESQSIFGMATSQLRDVHTLLDIGPGIRPQKMIRALVHICAEPYVEYARLLAQQNPDLIVLNCDWAEALSLFPEESVDAVVLMDVVEHLEKAEGRRLLDATIRLARGSIIVATPLGFLPQGDDELLDAWGLRGVEWQVHRSGWLPDDFPEWDVFVCEDFHRKDAYGRPLQQPHGALVAVLDKGGAKAPEDLSSTVGELRRTLRETRVAYEQSTSWKLTSPVRKLAHLLRRG